MVENRAASIVLTLERVLSGDLDAGQALKAWPDIEGEKDELLKAVWHDLKHFEVDADIREKDPAYAKHQIQTIEKGIRKIRNKFNL